MISIFPGLVDAGTQRMPWIISQGVDAEGLPRFLAIVSRRGCLRPLSSIPIWVR